MKALFFSLLMFAGLASAETITLSPMECTGTNICFNVPNNAGVSIDYISNAVQYRRLIVSINGELYDSGLWTVNGPLVNVPLYAGDGSLLLATLSFTSTTGTCHRSGRVTVCPHHVMLNSGTLVR